MRDLSTRVVFIKIFNEKGKSGESSVNFQLILENLKTRSESFCLFEILKGTDINKYFWMILKNFPERMKFYKSIL